MRKSRPQSKRSIYTPDPQVICEVQNMLRGRIFHADVPTQLHGLEEQKRLVKLYGGTAIKKRKHCCLLSLYEPKTVFGEIICS